MTTNETPVKYEKRGHRAYITLSRPRALNAINRELRFALRDILIDFRDDDNLLGAIVTGEGGRAFSAGADLKEQNQALSSGETRNVPMWPFRDVNLFKPVIAAIDGYCLGGGLEIAMACDIVIAAESARFGVPEIRNVGGYPGSGGIHRLPRHIPIKVAMRMLLTGDHITAEEARRVGLISPIVPDSQLMEGAGAMARRVNEEARTAWPF